MNRAQSIRLIRAAFQPLCQIHEGWTDIGDRLFVMNKASEKKHREHRPAGLSGALSVNDAAKLFAIKHIAESLDNPDRFTVDDIISIRNECLYAQAFAKKHNAAIREGWNKAGVKIEDILSLDYVELMG